MPPGIQTTQAIGILIDMLQLSNFIVYSYMQQVQLFLLNQYCKLITNIIYLITLECWHDLDMADIEDLANKTSSFSGMDLKSLVEETSTQNWPSLSRATHFKLVRCFLKA